MNQNLSYKLSYSLGLLLLISSCFLFNNCNSSDSLSPTDDWILGPFVKLDEVNPCLRAKDNSTFYCPLQQDSLYWEIKDVFNPASVVKDGKIYLLYRAEDDVGKLAGTSRIGLAWSDDGQHFTRHPVPIFYPDNDSLKIYEWEGGCEDPRIVEDENGTYILTYTAWDGQFARLCIASSKDLYHWKKHGLAFGDAYAGKYRDVWSKSGAIITEMQDHRMVAKKINNKYWMYWGDTDMFLASSDNLMDWTPIERTKETRIPSNLPKDGKEDLLRVFGPRPGYFDSDLVEPGPPAMLGADGILLLYNSRNRDNPNLPEGTYTAGQILLDANDPSKVIDRSDTYFFKPEKDYEIIGQVNNVTFIQGLSLFKGNYYLYYGTADSKIAVAVGRK